jgi:hypothetical protein
MPAPTPPSSAYSYISNRFSFNTYKGANGYQASSNLLISFIIVIPTGVTLPTTPVPSFSVMMTVEA